jgi:hypothetical protein
MKLSLWQRGLILTLLFVMSSACAAVNPARFLSGNSNKPGPVPSIQARTQSPVPSISVQGAETQPNGPTQTKQARLDLDKNTAVTPSPEEAPGKNRKTLLDEYMPRHEKIGETEHFIFYAQDDYYPVDQGWWEEQAEEIYDYVSQRVGADSPIKISVGLLPAQKQACPIRGLASSDSPPIILLFADPDASPDYLLGVLAHEVGHAVPGQGYAGRLPNDLALTEGLATWASGKYWDAWMGVPSIDFLVKEYIDAGIYLPIHENVDLTKVYPWQEGVGEGCLARRDQIYSQWGSFVGFLIDRYGWEKVHELFESAYSEKQGSETVEYPTNYEKVLGKDLKQLEEEWLDIVIQKTRSKVQGELYLRCLMDPAVA